MNTISKLAAAAALATTALAAGAPAMAQSYGYGLPYGYVPTAYGRYDPAAALHAREDRIGGWIRASLQSGRIGGWQADGAFARLQRVRDDERRARWGGGGYLRPDQIGRLNDRLSLIADELRLDGDRTRFDRDRPF